MTPTPALKACLDWWRTLNEEERRVFAKARLDPIRWWAKQDVYLEAARRCAATNGIDPEAADPSYYWIFEKVDVIGGMAVWGWYKRGKSWGELLRIRALRPTDPFDDLRLLVVHGDKSPFYQRMRRRDWMKSKLGSKWAKLVNLARKSTLQDFRAKLIGGDVKMNLPSEGYASQWREIRAAAARGECEINEEKGRMTRVVEPDPAYLGAAQIIRRRLKMEITEFWRYCKGTKLIPEDRMREPQLALFDT